MNYKLTSYFRGCNFAVTEKTKSGKQLQVGCELGRIKKFRELGTEMTLDKSENGKFFTIERFCTCYRPDEWIATLSNEEKKDPVKAVREEISIRMGVIILFNCDHTEEELKRTIRCFSKQTISPRYVVVVNSKVEYNELAHSLLTESFPDKEKTNVHLVQCADKDLEDFLKIDEAFKHFLNGFYYVVNSGTEHSSDFIEKFDSYVNDELSQVVMVKPNDGVGGLLMQASLHKMLKGSRAKIDEETETLDDENITQRVLNMGIKNGGVDLIKDWSEII